MGSCFVIEGTVILYKLLDDLVQLGWELGDMDVLSFPEMVTKTEGLQSRQYSFIAVKLCAQLVRLDGDGPAQVSKLHVAEKCRCFYQASPAASLTHIMFVLSMRDG